jgi:hypothetical protein
VHDSNRTHLYDCAHFGGVMADSNQVFAYSSEQDYITPYNIVDRGPNELYIYGGGYGDNPDASGSFVSRVEPGTFNEVWRRVLINTHVTGEWNYPGVLNVMSDGTLIVIYGHQIAKIDPETGDVLAEETLPEMIGGRVTTTTYEGQSYIYLPGTTQLFRYTYADGAFSSDPRGARCPTCRTGRLRRPRWA